MQGYVTPCLRRVRTLEDTGCIRGYHADIDTEALGFGVTVFANVGLHSQAEADLVAFQEKSPVAGSARPHAGGKQTFY